MPYIEDNMGNCISQKENLALIYVMPSSNTQRAMLVCIKGSRVPVEPQPCILEKNFIEQKLQDTPDLVGDGHLFGPQIRIRKGSMVTHYEG